jgi:DNA repair exonuclease SbcCD nuclease subunit
VKSGASSDWHGDWKTLGVNRFDELEGHANAFVARCVAEKVERAFFLGDLSDPDSGPCVFRAVGLLVEVALALYHNGISFHAVAGNHDVIEDGSGDTTLTPLRKLAEWTQFSNPPQRGGMNARIFVHDRPEEMLIGERRPNDARILALPFTAASHAYQPDEVVREVLSHTPREAPLIVLSHLAVAGIQPGEETIEMPRGREILFPYDLFEGRENTLILQGHYHRGQVFQLPGHPPIHVVGSLMRLTFGEEQHEPRFLIVEGA